MTELRMEDMMLFEEGSHVELLDAHFVDWSTRYPILPSEFR